MYHMLKWPLWPYWLMHESEKQPHPSSQHCQRTVTEMVKPFYVIAQRWFQSWKFKMAVAAILADART